MNSYNKTYCRLCNYYDLEFKFNLTETYPANNLQISPYLNKEKFPLDIYQCKHCGHIQLGIVIDPHSLYENYLYTSGTTKDFIEYLDKYAEDIVKEYNITKDDYIVEIASNDGTFLNSFKKLGIDAIGVDPAKNIVKKANKKGLRTLCMMYDEQTNEEILSIFNRKPKIIVANNVFAHIDTLEYTFFELSKLLDEKGILIFEVGYFVDVYEKGLFDTIYHEHLSYHTVKPLKSFLRKFGLDIIKVERTDSQGGSIRVHCQFSNSGSYKIDNSARELIKYEEQLELYQPDTVRNYYKKIEQSKRELISLLESISDKKIVIYGAPAKATTLLNHFKIEKYIDYVVDDNHLKQELYIPGTNLKIRNPMQLDFNPPDYILILSWNFVDLIMKKLEYKYDCIILLPYLRIEHAKK